MELETDAAANDAVQGSVATSGANNGVGEFLAVNLRRGGGFLLSKRAGSSTPVPSWKLEGDAGEADRILRPGSSSTFFPPRRISASPSASARQLGASLWQIQDLLPSLHHRNGDPPEPPPPHSPIERNSGGFREASPCSSSRHHRVIGPASNSYSLADAADRVGTPHRHASDREDKPRSGHCCGRNTSTELLRVLNRIWSLEEKHANDVRRVKALKSELQQAQACVRELVQERQRHRRESEALVVKIAGMEEERRLGRRLEKEVSQLKAAVFKAVVELERERKVNLLLEDLCDEFAEGIRRCEDEVRSLRQNSLEEYYELQHDKSALHMSEAWLDERMRMKAAEARGDLAERAAVAERLSNEIRSFLQVRRSVNPKSGDVAMVDRDKDGNLRRQSLESVHLNGTASAPRLAEDDDDSVASDLHCFELTVHGDDDIRKPSTDKVHVWKPPTRSGYRKNTREARDEHGAEESRASDYVGTPMRSLPQQESTLKAKLLQARLEGRHARLRTLGQRDEGESSRSTMIGPMDRKLRRLP